MKRRYRIRFNLSRGKNYMKWKVVDTETKEIQYLEPESVSFIMEDCYLRNQKKAAEDIYKGANKRVCAWIECNNLQIHAKCLPLFPQGAVRYNPRVLPYWRFESFSGHEVKADGAVFDCLTTVNENIFKMK